MKDKSKYRVLIISRSDLICHIFHVIASYFQWFTFYVADSAEMAYMMYQDGNFDLAMVEPFGDYNLEIDEDIMAVIEEIQNTSSMPIIYLGPVEIPSALKDIFYEKILFPFDKMQLESTLNRIMHIALGPPPMQSSPGSPAHQRNYSKIH